MFFTIGKENLHSTGCSYKYTVRTLHAFEHDKAELSDLAGIYTTLSKIRVFASRKVIEEAENAVKAIVATYTKENKHFQDVATEMNHDFINPLRGFSEACHNDLRHMTYKEEL